LGEIVEDDAELTNEEVKEYKTKSRSWDARGCSGKADKG
jgi:hypothetical protein